MDIRKKTMVRNFSLAAVSVFGLSMAGAAQGAFVVVEDWEGFDEGQEPSVSSAWVRTTGNDSHGRIVTDPLGGGDQVLQMTSGFANRGYYTDLGDKALPDNAVSTLFLRLYADGGALGVRLTDLEEVTNAWYNEDRAGRGVDANRVFADVTLDEDTWYNVWFVVDLTPANQTYDIYLSKGNEAGVVALSDLPIHLTGDSSSVDNSPDALDTFAIHLAGSTNTGLSSYVGDIWVDTTGANVGNPIPEPATLMLAATGSLLAFGRRRK